MTDKNELILGTTKDGGLVQFNLDDVKGKVADQMRAFLLNMMPAQAFNQVIETAFKKLTEPRPALDYQGKPDRSKPEKPSELEEMVVAEMRKQLAEKVAEWGKKWRETPVAERVRDKLMSDLIDRAASGFVARVASQIVQESLANFDAAANTIVCACGRIAPRNQSCSDCGNYNV